MHSPHIHGLLVSAAVWLTATEMEISTGVWAYVVFLCIYEGLLCI